MICFQFLWKIIVTRTMTTTFPKRCQNQLNSSKSVQNPSKIEVPKKVFFFIDFLLNRPIRSKCRHVFRIVFSNQNATRTIFLTSLFACVLGLKNLPKACPRRGPNDEKSMPKTCCFSTLIFSGFGLHFGGPWASQKKLCWQFWLQKTNHGARFWCSKKQLT